MIECQYFGIGELVPPSVYEDRGDKAWALIDPRLIEVLDSLRLQLDTPLTVNNWHRAVSRTQSGLRTAESEHYSQYSQHSFGRAADVIGYPAEEIRQAIRSKEIVLPYPVWIELEVDWLHVDVRNSSDPVTFFRP